MRIIEHTTEFHIPEKTAVAIGKFDGIHRGHRALLKSLTQAKGTGLKTAVFTFDPSPAAYFAGCGIRELTTAAEKRLLFERTGIDYLVEYPFGRKTAAVEPKRYVTEFLLDKMHAALVVAGEDVSFGKEGRGDRTLLENMSVTCGFRLEIIQKLIYRGREISSTYVREKVEQGDMETAAKLLGAPYFVSGTIESGKKLGRKLGIPTANLYPEAGKLLPPNGVYFSNVILRGRDAVYHGVTNIGTRPTVNDGNRLNAETFLLDFDEEIYNQAVRVELLHYQRPEQSFEGVEQLKAAILQNIGEAERYFS